MKNEENPFVALARFTREEIMRYATDDDLEMIRWGFISQSFVKSLSDRIFQGRKTNDH